MLIALFAAEKVERIGLVVGLRRHIEGGGASDEDRILRESGGDLGEDRAPLFPRGIEEELVRDVGLGPEQGEGHAPGRMEFDASADVIREADDAAQPLDTLGDGLPVAGEREIAQDLEVPAFVAVFGVLETVIADDVHRVLAHLCEDPPGLTSARDDDADPSPGEIVEDGEVFVGDPGPVLGERSVEVKCKYFFLHGASPLRGFISASSRGSCPRRG